MSENKKGLGGRISPERCEGGVSEISTRDLDAVALYDCRRDPAGGDLIYMDKIIRASQGLRLAARRGASRREVDDAKIIIPRALTKPKVPTYHKQPTIPIRSQIPRRLGESALTPNLDINRQADVHGDTREALSRYVCITFPMTAVAPKFGAVRARERRPSTGY